VIFFQLKCKYSFEKSWPRIFIIRNLFITFGRKLLKYMKIISYNVNGIRAAITKGFLEWLQHANPDVICLQEIKATEDQIPKIEIEAAGYPYQ